MADDAQNPMGPVIDQITKNPTTTGSVAAIVVVVAMAVNQFITVQSTAMQATQTKISDLSERVVRLELTVTRLDEDCATKLELEQIKYAQSAQEQKNDIRLNNLEKTK